MIFTPEINNTIPDSAMMGECMTGSVGQYKGSWYVRWWDNIRKKDVKIYQYKGIKIESKRMAKKLLSVMQGDVENGTFFIERYTQKNFSDVIPFIDDWIENTDGLSKATQKGYVSYVTNHIKPFFQENSHISLPEIHIDVLRKFRRSLESKGLSPKMQWNIMYCLHSILDAAWVARRIPAIPPFPKKKEYKLIKKPILWLPEDRQVAIIENIPDEHQPIFWFLKYHLRRPAEACALHKEDFDGDTFHIHRSVSAREITQKTKTGEIHTIPCHPNFEKHLLKEAQKQKTAGVISPFLFVNISARKPGKRYTNESLNRIWKAACKAAGENISLYAGLKHSSCSQYINEKGLSESELQIITDHARIESVRAYAKTEIKRKRELMLKNIFDFSTAQNRKTE